MEPRPATARMKASPAGVDEVLRRGVTDRLRSLRPSEVPDGDTSGRPALADTESRASASARARATSESTSSASITSRTSRMSRPRVATPLRRAFSSLSCRRTPFWTSVSCISWGVRECWPSTPTACPTSPRSIAPSLAEASLRTTGVGRCEAPRRECKAAAPTAAPTCASVCDAAFNTFGTDDIGAVVGVAAAPGTQMPGGVVGKTCCAAVACALRLVVGGKPQSIM